MNFWNEKIKFFSILNSGDSKYKFIYENFIRSLDNVGLSDVHENILVGGETGNYGTKKFKKIVHQRIPFVRDFLRKGYTVWNVDLDLVFLKDPTSYLFQYFEDYDLIAQKDKHKLCGGFYVAKPTPLVRKLFDNNCPSRMSEQNHMHKKLREEEFQGLKIKFLDIDLYPYGEHWYKNNSSIKDPYIVHYNWIKGAEEKRHRMKKYGHWYL